MRSQKRKDFLHFYIWVNQQNHHYSLVANVDNYYIFLDSCSIFFRRWPNKAIISENENDNDNLFNKFKTFVMFSFLQHDEFNCVSFAFAFITILIQLYENGNKNKLLNHFLKYFKFLYNGMFFTETDSIDLNSIEPQIYYLPKDILELSQSISKLEYLLEQAKKFREDEVKTINKVISEIKKGKKISL